MAIVLMHRCNYTVFASEWLTAAQHMLFIQAAAYQKYLLKKIRSTPIFFSKNIIKFFNIFHLFPMNPDLIYCCCCFCRITVSSTLTCTKTQHAEYRTELLKTTYSKHLHHRQNTHHSKPLCLSLPASLYASDGYNSLGTPRHSSWSENAICRK